jgi:serine protease Do
MIHGIAAAQTTSPAPASTAELARSMNRAFGDVYEKVSPGVVVIEAREADAVPSQGTPLMQFFQQQQQGRPPQRGAMNQGSGFIMTPDGYILTNSHVLEGARADGVRVTLKDGRKFEAKLVGIDPKSDLAVLKINATGLPVVAFGDSDKLRVGEFAFALGAPYDLRYTFTYGIISAKGRTDLVPGRADYEEYIQTDAAINPGNSGGPLVDIDGHVIGVNTLIYGLDQGLGFAIPINFAKRVADQLISGGRAVRAWLGISIRALDDVPEFTAQFPNAPKGIFVDQIIPGTPASESALRQWDVITAVNDIAVATPRELQKVIFEKQVGDEVQIDVWRENRVVKMKIRTAEHLDTFLPVMNQRSRPPVLEEEEPEAEPPITRMVPAPQKPFRPNSSAGLELRLLTPDIAIAMKLQAQEGLLVTSVQPGSAAAVAGVRVGDVITAAGSQPVRSKGDFDKAVSGAENGAAVMIDINRGDQKTYAIVKP